MPNKHERKLAEDKVIRRRNRELTWPELEPIPIPRLIALKGKGYRIGRRSDRKGFHKWRGSYGHFASQYGVERHLPRKDLIERADKREALADIKEGT